jgi:glycosyltransferase involved in cell wall biosynthesis
MTIRPLILQPDSEPYGANRALLRSIEAMPEGAVRPVVVFPYEGAALTEYEAAGCEVVIEDLAVLRRSSAGVRGLWNLAKERRSTGETLARIAERHACHLVHTNSMTIVSGGPAASRAQIPHVWQLREAPRERGMRARALGMLLSRADLVLAVSRAAAELVPKGRARIVYDGFDLPEARPRGPQTPLAQPQVLLAGMIGRISPSKAPDVAVRALAELDRRGDRTARLALAGTVYQGYESYARNELLNDIAARRLSHRVDILGWLDDPEPLYDQLDVLIMATATGEGFPGAALEALAHGVPVVSCATGGIDELVLHEQTGLVCPPGDAIAVADALERIRDDAPLRHHMQATARTHAARWSVEASAERLLAAWRSVVPELAADTQGPVA